MTKLGLIETIGNTPIVQFKESNKLFAKLEWANPSGSLKDRAALFAIRQAERKGLLKPNMTIIEASSGNMGIALSAIGNYLGYKVIVFMSEMVSRERRDIISAYGGRYILTDPKYGTLGARDEAIKKVNSDVTKYWFADQFNNKDNAMAHYQYTAEEIIKKLPEVEILIAGVGSGGTICGISQKLKEYNQGIRIIAVLPEKGFKIQGMQNPYMDFRGNVYDTRFIDEEILISFNEMKYGVHSLCQKENIFGGMTSGAVYAASQKINLIKKKTLLILADKGDKYFSTGLFS